MKERINAMLKSEPSLAIAKRASFLVVAGGPRNQGIAGDVNRFPPTRLALSGAVSGLYAGMTAAPQLALESAVDQALGGSPTNPQEVGAHRKALLLGNAGLIAAGLLTQRTINHHSRHSGLLTRAGRTMATQLTIGAAAASIVVISDTVLGPLANRKDVSSLSTTALRTWTLRAQIRTLQKAAGTLTLPTQPEPYDYVD